MLMVQPGWPTIDVLQHATHAQSCYYATVCTLYCSCCFVTLRQYSRELPHKLLIRILDLLKMRQQLAHTSVCGWREELE